MEPDKPDLDTFVHALSSPLTALRGASDLLRRRLHKDPLLESLLDAIDRGIERIQIFGDLVVRHADREGDSIVVRLPGAMVDELGAARRLAPVPLQLPPPLPPPPILSTVTTESIRGTPHASNARILLVSDDQSYTAGLANALAPLKTIPLAAAGVADVIDATRRLRPDLVIFDLRSLLTWRVARIITVLSDDPDTKMIPLLLLVEPGSSIPAVVPPGQAVARNAMPARIVEVAHEVIDAALSRSHQHQHILVVDDEVDIRETLALTLSDEGYLVTAVGTGAEALKVSGRTPFDLIILDLMLPDLDGLAVLGGLRAQPQTVVTPIILLSALVAPAEKVRGLQLGADDYVTKPFSGAELLARVQAALRRREIEGGANPSTRLPGNTTIERSISQRIADGRLFAICYCDLDNFKAYNDTYGFFKGDAVIQQTARTLTSVVRTQGNPDDFVGHIGGDDFVVITTPDRAEAICRATITEFDELAPLFYDPETRRRGFITGTDRLDNPAFFPLLSISIAVISSTVQPFSHPGEVAQRSIKPKHHAKRLHGSVFVVESPE